jgi:YVTN family beta-propeller protein
MYVTAILSQAIAEIDVLTREVLRVFQLSGDPRPAAITRDDRTMYVQYSALHGFVELDLESGSETRKIEWPDPGTRPAGYNAGPLITACHGIGISPDDRELWAASNIEGNIRVYSLPALEEQAVIDVGVMPNWIAFSRDGSTAYVTNTDPAASHGTVSVIDVATRQVIVTLDVGAAPKRVHRVDVP